MFSRLTSFIMGDSQKMPTTKEEEEYLRLEASESDSETTEEEEVTLGSPILMNKQVHRRQEELRDIHHEPHELLIVVEKTLTEYEERNNEKDKTEESDDDLPPLVSDSEIEEEEKNESEKQEKREPAYYFFAENGESFGVCNQTGAVKPAHWFDDPCKDHCQCDDCLVEISSEEEWMCGDCASTLVEDNQDDSSWFCSNCGSLWFFQDEVVEEEADYQPEEPEFIDNPTFEGSELVEISDDEDDGPQPMEISEEDDITSIEDDSSFLRSSSEIESEILSSLEGETTDEENEAEMYEKHIEALLDEMWKDANRTANDAVDKANQLMDKAVQEALIAEFSFEDEGENTWKFVGPNEEAFDESFAWPEPDTFEFPSFVPFPAPSAVNPIHSPQPSWARPTTDQIEWPQVKSAFDDFARPDSPFTATDFRYITKKT